MQRLISTGNETLSMQIRTACEEKCAEDGQRREWDAVGANTHEL
jgi:hypothetical protein